MSDRLFQLAINLDYCAEIPRPTLICRYRATIARLDGVKAAEVEAQVSIVRLRNLLQLSLPENALPILDPVTMSQALRDLGLTASV